MKDINTLDKLTAAIQELEAKHQEEGRMLKEQFNTAYDSIKPINLIKSTLKEVTQSSEVKDELINTAVAITAGYLSKVIFEAASNSPEKEAYGTAIQQGVRLAIANNPGVVKTIGIGFMKIFISAPAGNSNDVNNNGTG